MRYILNIQKFGGRGQKQPGTTTRGRGTLTKHEGAITINGDKIEFEGTLTQTGKDPILSGDRRRRLEEWEARRATAKVEYANVIDKNGSFLGEVRGAKGYVKVPYV